MSSQNQNQEIYEMSSQELMVKEKELLQERKRLRELLYAINCEMTEIEKEKSCRKIDEILSEPIADPNYRFVLENIDEFQRSLDDVLAVVSSQFCTSNCTENIVHSIIYSFQPSRTDFVEWVDDLIFDNIRNYRGKTDATEYAFHHSREILRFFPKKEENKQ